jgi:truncated hemoglobin YjbI
MTSHSTSPDSVYARIGGEQAIRALVGRFYDLMDQHEQLTDAPLREAIWQAFVGMADHLVNTQGAPACANANPMHPQSHQSKAVS